MQQLGFVSAIMWNKSFEDVVNFASENRFRCVEMMCWPATGTKHQYAGVSHINAGDISDGQADYIRNYLKMKGVFISGLGYYPNPLDPDKNDSAFYTGHIKKVITTASKLCIPVMNTFIGRDQTKTVEDNFEIFKETWPAIVKHAENNNVKIGIENCPMLFARDEWPGGKNLATTPAMWEKIFDYIPSPNFGLNYDPSHMIWQFMDEVQPIYDFREKIFHIHLKDAMIFKDKLDKYGSLGYPVLYHTPKIPGLGQVRWKDFFAALTNIKYQGPVCVEVEDKAFEGSDEIIRKALLISRNYLSQFLDV
jgi:sugar phosphate isomerase/epimerase